MAAWRFYVYDVLSADGQLLYVGKGSGRRNLVSGAQRGGIGMIVAMFKKESDAYKFERDRIAELAPTLNRHPGGNGCRVQAMPRTRYLAAIERLGTRVYAARLALAYGKQFIDPSKLDALRQVAYGCRA